MNYSAWTIVTTLLVATTLPVQASVYTTASGSTRFVLENGQVEYTTKIQGKPWYGTATVTSVPVPQSGVFRYQGDFQDNQIGAGDNGRICSGTIDITHSLPNKTFAVTWTVTGGRSCPSLGQKVTLNLVDALPRADSRGDFTPAIVNQWNGGTQESSWINWRVVSADGALNCRTSPNGSVKMTYARGQQIKALIDRSGGATKMANGAPWIRTTDQCFVRANSRFIQPTN